MKVLVGAFSRERALVGVIVKSARRFVTISSAQCAAISHIGGGVTEQTPVTCGGGGGRPAPAGDSCLTWPPAPGQPRPCPGPAEAGGGGGGNLCH